MKTKGILVILGMLLLIINGKLFAQVNISMLGSAGAYSQNFNTLANSGSGTWTDNSTITGWYSNQTTCDANTGTTTTANMYSFGTTSNSDRALGSVASSSNSIIKYGVRIQNNTGQTVDRIYLQFTGEQWRHGTNSPGIQSMQVTYSQSSSSFNGVISGGLSLTNIAFWSPQYGGSGTALDGNLDSNRLIIAAVLNIGLLNGEELFIQWEDTDDSGFDHALAIDDVVIAFYNSESTLPSVSTIGKFYINESLLLGGDLAIDSILTLQSGSTLGLNGNTLTLSGKVSGTGTLKSNGSSNLIVNGSGTLGTLYMDQTTSGTTNLLNNFTFNRKSNGILNLGNEMQILGVVTHSDGILSTNSNLKLVASGISSYGQIAGSGSGSISGPVSMQMIVNGTSSGWRNFTSPFDTVSAGQLGNQIILATSNGTVVNSKTYDMNLYSWTESSGVWTGASNSGSSLYGTGFNLYIFEPNTTTITLAGNYSPSDINLGSLVKTGTTANVSGWHLIPNPYPSALDWNSITKDPNISGTYYIWSVADGNYRQWNGGSGSAGQFIPPMHAFWVQANSTLSTDLVLSSSNRTTNTQNHFGKRDELTNHLSIQVDALQGTYKDQTEFYSHNSPFNSPSLKRFGLDEAPSIWLVYENEPVSILPKETLSNEIIPIGFSTSISGRYTLKLSLNNPDAQKEFWLEDRKTSTWHKVLDGDFSFDYVSGEPKTGRFFIHIKEPTPQNVETLVSPNSYAYSESGNLHLIHSETNFGWNLMSFHGTVIQSGQSDSNEAVIKNLSPGIYLLQFHDASGTHTIKVGHF